MNVKPQEIKYCVVCDIIIMILIEESSEEMVCSEECRVTFADFEVFSEDCCPQTHEYVEHVRAFCVQCDLKTQEPITSKFCGELCETQFALEHYWDEQEKYIENMRQQHVEEDYEDYN